MKTWHYNIVDIVKSPEFKQALVSCLEELEGNKKHDIVISMLKNYYNHRNKGFTSNWLYLPVSRVTLHINKKGVYFEPEFPVDNSSEKLLDGLNSRLFEAIGKRLWVVTFTKTKPKKLRDKNDRKVR